MFKRKIYNKMIQWKNESNGKTALLIKGPRRVVICSNPLC